MLKAFCGPLVRFIGEIQKHIEDIGNENKQD